MYFSTENNSLSVKRYVDCFMKPSLAVHDNLC